MDTAKILEEITDRGVFERLVISIISKADKNYKYILQTGVNASGEPIKSPVDGFCSVPGANPPHFIMLQSTTTERKDLEKKWLYDHTIHPEDIFVPTSKDGDLIKVGHLTQNIRKEFPNAKFTVILVSNKHLDVPFLQRVYKKAEEFKIICDIWEQSRLSNFLDNTPEGHWLRKEYLGIEAEMLSDSLLRSLCKESLTHYERDVLLTNSKCLVSREIEEHIQEGIYSNRYTFQFLVGESGFGKSIVAYLALQKHLSANGYGLWVPADLVKDCTSLTDLLDKTLQCLSPHLLHDSGREALKLIPEGSQILLIIDDVDRSDAPIKLIHKLLSWSEPQQSGPPESQQEIMPNHIIVCPVWPNVRGLIDHGDKTNPWINDVFIGTMNSTEGSLAVRLATSQVGIEITNTEANALATRLGDDPFLIGLFSSLVSNTKPSDLYLLTEDVIGKFISMCVSEIASSPNASYLPTEYRKTLLTMSIHMLQTRRLHPFWNEIEVWMGKDYDTLQKLRDLVKHGKICRLTDKCQFTFRHDRIREFLLTEGMVTIFSGGSSDADLLSEPFYAEIIGRALVRSPQNNKFLKQMRNWLPLALVEANRHLGASTSAYGQEIIKEIKEWLHNNYIIGSIPHSLLDAVCRSLIETDSPSVLEITDGLPSDPLILLARLRNGCAVSGSIYCSIMSPLSIKNIYFDNLLEQAKSRHKDKLVRELKQLLKSNSITNEIRYGVLVLSGFLSFPELQDEIIPCWQLAADKMHALPGAIWASIQCCTTEPVKALDPLMAYWDGLSDEQDSDGRSPKGNVADELRFAPLQGVNNEIINYLIAQCDIYKSLRWSITRLLEPMDAPDAIEYIVRSAADLERSISGTNKFILWLLTLTHTWDTSFLGGKRMSQASTARLKNLWEDTRNDTFVRHQAFRLWLCSVDWGQIDILRSISSDSPLYLGALGKRVRLGDRSVIQNLLPLLSKETHWFNYVHYIWSEEIKNSAQHHLESFINNIPKDFTGGWSNAHYDLSNILMKIPTEDAEELMEKNWNHLGFSPLFIQTALYVGTPRCLELADSSIRKCPSEIELFEHLSIHYGFLDSERQKYLTQKHLENLLPYLDRLGEHELSYCVDACERMGISEWGLKHLYNRLNPNKIKRYYPSDDDLIQELNMYLTEKFGTLTIRYWLEGLDRRHISQDRFLNVVDKWLASHPTIKGLNIAALCFHKIGKRKDLLILEKYTIEGPPNEVNKIKNNAKFFIYRRSLD